MYYILKIGNSPWDIAILSSKDDLPNGALYLEVENIPEKPQNDNLVLIFDEDTNSLFWGESPQLHNQLELRRAERIQESKEKLANYLLLNPLYSNAHNQTYDYYNVTEEKQALLTSEFMGYQVEKAAGLNSIFTWNAVGKPCEVWQETEGVQLIKEIREYVKPLVKYQQDLEILLKQATTMKELEKIEIDYSTVHNPFEDNNNQNSEESGKIETEKVTLVDDTNE
jgi:hypothetical protein